MRPVFYLLMLSWLIGSGESARAQAVAVTMQLDTNTIVVGGSTVLRIYAQVVPSLRSNADRIFSWYVDVLNTNGMAATADYATMLKSRSDNDPLISSFGLSSGADRRGIYDTFLNLPGAGTSNRVELLAIPIQGADAGKARFSLRAGTGVQGLSDDFIVAPKDGGAPWTGGDYSLAQADLVVISLCNVRLGIQRNSSPGLEGTSLLQFIPCIRANHTVESRPLVDKGEWQPLAGAPHNSGSVTVTNTLAQKFFRVRIDPL